MKTEATTKMYFKKLKKLLSGVLLGAMMLTSISAMPVMATDSFTVVIEPMEDDTSTLAGEAKFKVSVDGLNGDIYLAGLTLHFSSDTMEYSGVEHIHDAENYTKTPMIAQEINADKVMTPGFACANSPLTVSGKTELFIITFESTQADKSGSVTLSFDDADDAEIGLNSITNKVYPSNTPSATAQANTTGNSGQETNIKLKLDSVPNFNSSDFINPITVILKNEETNKEYPYTISSAYLSNGAYVIKESLVSGKYTVTVEANGFKTYIKENFDISNTLTIDTDDFMPGDVNGDDKIDLVDYAIFMSVFDGELTTHSSLTDFDRDGNTTGLDLAAIKASLASEEANGEIETSTKTNMTVSADDTSVKVGDTFTLTLKAEDVYTYFIKGTWDNTLATLESKTVKGTTNDDNKKVINDCANGKFTLMNTVDDAEDDGTVYELKFKAKKAGSFSLTFADSYAMDAVSNINNAKADKLNITNATVTISAGEGGAGGGTGGGTGGGGGGTGGGGGAAGGGSTPSVTTPSTTTPSTTTPSTTTPSTETFTDIENYDWAKNSIYTLKNLGIISGVSETEYAPANNIKRGDFILILVRMLDLTTPYTENFADVPESAYYYDALGKAKAAGIATGDGTNFMPENSITRQDLITLAYRAFLNAGYITENTDTTALDNFNDREEISDYAVNAMASMVNAGIIKGSDNGGVNPKGNATRAEVAVMCARLVELMK